MKLTADDLLKIASNLLERTEKFLDEYKNEIVSSNETYTSEPANNYPKEILKNKENIVERYSKSLIFNDKEREEFEEKFKIKINRLGENGSFLEDIENMFNIKFTILDTSEKIANYIEPFKDEMDYFLEKPLTKKEKIAITLFNFVHIEEVLIKKNSVNPIELTLTNNNAKAYYHKLLLLSHYIETEIKNDKAVYKNEKIQLKIKLEDVSENEEKYESMAEYIFAVRNSIVHNRFEIENGMLKIIADESTDGYTFKIDIPISLLHYVISPIVKSKEETEIIHTNQILSPEIYKGNIPFTLDELTDEYFNIIYENIDFGLQKIDKSFNKNKLSIYGSEAEIETIEEFRAKERLNNKSTLAYYSGITNHIRDINDFYHNMVNEKTSTRSNSKRSIKIIYDSKDNNKLIETRKQINSKLCYLKKAVINMIRSIDKSKDINKEETKNQIINNYFKSFSTEIPKLFKTANEEIFRIQKNALKHANVENRHYYYLSLDRKDNNKLIGNLLIEVDNIMGNPSVDDASRLLIEIYNILFITEENIFDKEKIKNIFLNSENFVQDIYYEYELATQNSNAYKGLEELIALLGNNIQEDKLFYVLNKLEEENLKTLFIYNLDETIIELEEEVTKRNYSGKYKEKKNSIQLQNKIQVFEEMKKYNFNPDKFNNIILNRLRPPSVYCGSQKIKEKIRRRY